MTASVDRTLAHRGAVQAAPARAAAGSGRPARRRPRSSNLPIV